MSELKETKKMKIIALYEQSPKEFEPDIDHKNSPIGPQKVKTTPKLSQNQMSELKETKKMKIIALYEQTPKQHEPDPNSQNSLFRPKKSQRTTWEKMLFFYMSRPKTYFET